MPKQTMAIEADPYEADYMSDLTQALAVPLPHEQADPPTRPSNDWQLGQRHGEWGYQDRHPGRNAGRKPLLRK